LKQTSSLDISHYNTSAKKIILKQNKELIIEEIKVAFSLVERGKNPIYHALRLAIRGQLKALGICNKSDRRKEWNKVVDFTINYETFNVNRDELFTYEEEDKEGCTNVRNNIEFILELVKDITKKKHESIKKVEKALQQMAEASLRARSKWYYGIDIIFIRFLLELSLIYYYSSQ